MNRLAPLPVASLTHEGVDRCLAALRAALDGSGPAIAPVPATSVDAPAHHEVPDDVALVVRTSGSTGEPRPVMLTTSALNASAAATHERLGGPGRWVLALPLLHIAGLAVLVRSLQSGTSPAVVGGDGGFDPGAAADVIAAARTGDLPLYASLVPTQLHRILATCDRDGTLPHALAPWRHLDAILVGGAATTPGLLDAARRAGLAVVTTYGMTETCGGCVYDGRPLAGVDVRVADGGIEVAGPVLARGYLDRPELDAAAFHTVGGTRWLRTHDAGVVTDGRLHVHGRTDDVIVTGAHKVSPAAVEAALAGQPGVGQTCVVGVPDDEWGRLVTAVVVPARDGPDPTLTGLRESVTRTLGAAAAPRRLVLVGALPLSGPGKVDRAAAARLAVQALQHPD